MQYALLPIGRYHGEQKTHCSCDVCKLGKEKKEFLHNHSAGKSEIVDDRSLKKDFELGRVKARASTGPFCFISKNWESRSLR